MAWRAVQEDPSCHFGWAIYGGFLSGMGKYEEGLSVCDRALAIAPGMPAAHWNRSMCLMGLGMWREGWADYQYGRINGLRPTRSLLPQWDGSPINGQTLFVWAEQGMGDTIQYLRFFRDAAHASGARIILEVQSALVDLCVANGFADMVHAQTPDRHLPFHADYQVALLDIPHILGFGTEHIEGLKYLDAEPDERYRGKVGFCWKGSTVHVNNNNRSLTDEEAKKFRVPNLVSMQHGHSLPRRKQKFEPTSMLETASALKALDCLVTVDTSIAHLAGALGVKTFMIVPTTNEPRWETDSERTRWYDSVNLIRTKPSTGLRAGLKKAMELVRGKD